VLVPIDRADLDTSDKEVVLRGLTREAVLSLQPYDHSAAAMSGHQQHSERYEQQVPRAAAGERDTKRITRSAEKLRLGKRTVQAGEVHIGKHVETEHVSQPVTRMKERVTVERRPVTNASASGNARIENDEIVVPVMEEEVIVEKRPVVKEELVVAKERVETPDTVETELRREEFDVRGTRDDMVGGAEDITRRDRKERP
jgi:uncharacterized protein (TIGR02271 family)